MREVLELQTQLDTQTLPARAWFNGTRQKPIEGVSMVYTFDNANAVSKRPMQYFEMMGKRYALSCLQRTFDEEIP
jgi:hypothetical protein